MKVTITNLSGAPVGLIEGAAAALGYVERGHAFEGRRDNLHCVTCTNEDGTRGITLWGDAEHIEVTVWGLEREENDGQEGIRLAEHRHQVRRRAE
jgi:hypothetical protein